MIQSHDDCSIPSPSLTQESIEACRQVTSAWPWMSWWPISDFSGKALNCLLFFNDVQVQTNKMSLPRAGKTNYQTRGKWTDGNNYVFHLLVAEKLFLLKEEVSALKEMKEGYLWKKQFTSISRSVSLKVTITDILIKRHPLQCLWSFHLMGGDSVGTV